MKLTPIEKGAFLKLFNRGGYILNFSTNDFNVFTLESIGIALCEHYGMSKGKSLSSYINEANDTDTIKLLNDLLAYYEFHYQWEIESDGEYGKLYTKCRQIMDQVLTGKATFVPAAESLKEKFSSDYISKQIDMMLGLQESNPTEAIGKAKELIESCCKTILDGKGIEYDKKWDTGKLLDVTMKNFSITPRDIPETVPEAESIKAILGNLRAIATNMSTLRNAYGSGHGKSARYKGLQARHAKLAVGSSITLVNFLWDTYDNKNL